MAGAPAGVDPVFIRVQAVQNYFKFSNLEMSRALGLSREAYRRQQVQRKPPAIHSMSRLDRHYGISIEWILFERGPMLLKERERLHKEEVERAATEAWNEAEKKYAPLHTDLLADEMKEMEQRMREIPQLRYVVMQAYTNYLVDHPDAVK